VLGRLFILFTAMTLVEVYVLMSVGEILGAELTIAIIILTAFIGSYLVRNQGIQIVKKLQTRLAAGEAPGQEIVEGIMLLVCGVLLVTPGFVTDTLGLLVLTPHIRGRLASAIIAQYKDRIIPQQGFTANAQNFHYSSTGATSDPFQQKPKTDKDGNVIEGDFVEVDRDDNKLN
jgi:UPF0716 protein FxsA